MPTDKEVWQRIEASEFETFLWPTGDPNGQLRYRCPWQRIAQDGQPCAVDSYDLEEIRKHARDRTGGGQHVQRWERRPDSASRQRRPTLPRPRAEKFESTTASARRHRIIDPMLTENGLSIYRWEKEAGVSSKVGQRYLDGKTRKLRAEQEKKLAHALGLDKLPD
jgi:hypothetical protein